MTKQEFIDSVLQGSKIEITKKDATVMIDEVFDSLQKAIKKDKKLTYPGFGTFSIRSRKARTGRNPRTGETIKIKASRTIAFRPAKNVKDKL